MANDPSLPNWRPLSPRSHSGHAHGCDRQFAKDKTENAHCRVLSADLAKNALLAGFSDYRKEPRPGAIRRQVLDEANCSKPRGEASHWDGSAPAATIPAGNQSPNHSGQKIRTESRCVSLCSRQRVNPRSGTPAPGSLTSPNRAPPGRRWFSKMPAECQRGLFLSEQTIRKNSS